MSGGRPQRVAVALGTVLEAVLQRSCDTDDAAPSCAAVLALLELLLGTRCCSCARDARDERFLKIRPGRVARDIYKVFVFQIRRDAPYGACVKASPYARSTLQESLRPFVCFVGSLAPLARGLTRAARDTALAAETRAHAQASLALLQDEPESTALAPPDLSAAD